MFNQADVRSSAVDQGFDVEPIATTAALYRDHLARLQGIDTPHRRLLRMNVQSPRHR
jgi:hypothetical protein